MVSWKDGGSGKSKTLWGWTHRRAVWGSQSATFRRAPVPAPAADGRPQLGDGDGLATWERAAGPTGGLFGGSSKGAAINLEGVEKSNGELHLGSLQEGRSVDSYLGHWLRPLGAVCLRWGHTFQRS